MKKIRIILWLGLLVLLAGLLVMKIVPAGKISYSSDFNRDSYFIKKITPRERIENQADKTLKIVGEPVYFSLYTPRRFNEAKVILKFRVDGKPDFTPIIEMGVLNDKTIWRYDLQPIDNEMINELPRGWNKIESDGVMFWQRGGVDVKQFSAIDEFIRNAPDSSQIALYNYNLKNNYKMSGYLAGKIYANKIEFSIQGNYQFYTYIKNEDLDFDFKFIDINKDKDRDAVDLNLYYENKLIDSRHLSDEGAYIEETGQTASKELKLKTSGLPEGFYKLEIKAGPDIITNEIISPQTKMAFANKIRLSAGANDILLYTNSRKMQFETANPGSLQKIRINGSQVDIDKTYQQFFGLSTSSIAILELPKGDLTVSGNGLFSFSQNQLFNPLLKKIDNTYDANQAGVNYIIAGYKPPKQQGQWLEAEADFDLAGAYRENNSYNFLISITGLENNIGNKNGVTLANIKIELKGKNIFSYIKNFFE